MENIVPREPDLVGKIFKDKDGKELQGQYFKRIIDFEAFGGSIDTEYNFFNGKIHGEHAIWYPDGLVESWDNGKFVKVLFPPSSDA